MGVFKVCLISRGIQGERFGGRVDSWLGKAYNRVMNKADMIDAIASKAKLTKADSKKAPDAIL
ncbi:MAG: hypothetical protein WCU88_03185 [Elusimicrobiota bacterium]|jgi:hypothetical protein